jgi:hypothetical protein
MRQTNFILQRLPATVALSNPLHKPSLNEHDIQLSIFQTLKMARTLLHLGSPCHSKICMMMMRVSIAPHHDSRYYQTYRTMLMEGPYNRLSSDDEPSVKIHVSCSEDGTVSDLAI